MERHRGIGIGRSDFIMQADRNRYKQAEVHRRHRARNRLGIHTMTQKQTEITGADNNERKA